MKNTIKMFVIIVMAMITALAFTACSQPTNGSSGSVAVTGVKLNKSATYLHVGGSAETLFATVEPADATNKSVNWSSSADHVATVDNNGTVTAGLVGTTTITVTTVDGSKIAHCTVTVSPVPVAVTGISLNRTRLTLSVGGSETLIPTFEPYNATNQNLTWSSSVPTVATVGNNGTVTARAAGTATITVTTVDGGKIAFCTVTVNSGSDTYYALSWVILMKYSHPDYEYRSLTYSEVSSLFTLLDAPLTPVGDNAGYITGSNASEAYENISWHLNEYEMVFHQALGWADPVEHGFEWDTFEKLLETKKDGVGLPSQFKTALSKNKNNVPIAGVYQHSSKDSPIIFCIETGTSFMGGGGNGGTFTVTGIPSTYNGKIAGFKALDDTKIDNRHYFQITDGSVSLPLWFFDGSKGRYVSYTGNDTVYGKILINDPNTHVLIVERYWHITFSNGSAEKTWSSGTD